MFKFKVDIFNEISWPHFKRLPNVSPLPLNEQVKKYNLYINELTYERNAYLHWLEGHKKGPKLTEETPTEDPFLLQEDGDYLLQEDGFKIKIPNYA